MIVMKMMIHRPNWHKDSQDLNTLFFRPAWNDDDDDDDDGNDDDDDNDGDGYPAYSHHDKIPPWWEYVSNDKGGNVSVSKSHHTW